MKIVDRKTFLGLPTGVLYSKYSSSWCFGDISIKGESTDYDDWLYTDILGWPSEAKNSNELFDLEKEFIGGREWKNEINVSARDGLFEEDQLFVIFDKEDIKALVVKLSELI